MTQRQPATRGALWHESGQVSLSGPLLRLAAEADEAFRLLAGIWDAAEERHPATLPAATLQRTDYLRSFPHQATFPVTLDPADANLGQFTAGLPDNGAGTVALTATAPVTEVLTPAACYHVYPAHAGEALAAPLHVTTVNTCFRRESAYVPLRRQWSFTMREVVCLGSAEETAAFRDRARDAAGMLCELAGLPVTWLPATDPFFRPRENPKYLLQKISPVKHEAVYGDLAIASVNLHHDHFGGAFGITRDGEPARSACLAFGIERWLFAVTDRHGADPASWPDLPDLARQVAAKCG